jgi:sirohydrochlorin ferrochelatase
VSVGIVVFAHGSRVEAANQAVRRVAAETARAGGFEHVEAAFLELGQPSLEGAVGLLAARGVRRVLVTPYFLTDGTHLERDLPKLVARAAAAHPEVEIRTTRALDGHPGLARIVADRAREGFAGWD